MGMQNDRKEYINWKRVFLVFALAASPLPTDAQLDEYGSELAKYGTCVSKQDFIDVSFLLIKAFVFRLTHGSTPARVLQLPRR